jgi:glucose/arabinose dehydrogenase
MLRISSIIPASTKRCRWGCSSISAVNMNFFFPRSLSALLVLPLVAAQCFPANSLTFRSPIVTAPGLHAVPIARNLTTPRGIAIDRRGTLLVIERGLGVTAFVENASTCVGGWLRSNVLNRTDLTQGIAVRGVELYVSTAGQVLKYAYNPATRTVSSTTPVVIVSGIPSDGGKTISHSDVGQLTKWINRTHHSTYPPARL